jgi:hypothetical protein
MTQEQSICLQRETQEHWVRRCIQPQGSWAWSCRQTQRVAATPNALRSGRNTTPKSIGFGALGPGSAAMSYPYSHT